MSFILIQTIAKNFFKAIISSSQVSISNNNIFFSYLSHLLWRTIISTLSNSDAKTLRHKKDKRYFNYKEREYIIYNY